jgi:hypothetical protein
VPPGDPLAELARQIGEEEAGAKRSSDNWREAARRPGFEEMNERLEKEAEAKRLREEAEAPRLQKHSRRRRL